MVEFYYNGFINETTSHYPFEIMYGLQPSTHANRLLPLIGATTKAADMTLLANIIDVVFELIKMSKNIMTVKSARTAPRFQSGDHVYLSTIGLHIRTPSRSTTRSFQDYL